MKGEPTNQLIRTLLCTGIFFEVEQGSKTACVCARVCEGNWHSGANCLPLVQSSTFR